MNTFFKNNLKFTHMYQATYNLELIQSLEHRHNPQVSMSPSVELLM